MNALRVMLILLFTATGALAATKAAPKSAARPAAKPAASARKASPAERTADLDTLPSLSEEVPVRTRRPISLSACAVGKTPFFGLTADVNVLPWLGLGLGYGYFSVEGVTGSFIPAYINVYPLTSRFTPFLEGGIDFMTVSFQSSNSLLNSTFRGTQLIVGAGLEYRFDFGLVARVDVVRFLNAQLFSPGASVGYALEVFGK